MNDFRFARTGSPHFDDASITQAKYTTWYPKTRTPDASTFEIALTLGGTVSAGAYTAGVMDYLFEALDTWYLAKANTPGEVPPHDVRVRIMAGASGGGINAAIAAVACKFNFPAVPLGTEKECGPKNPFYDPWVNLADMGHFLDTSDLETGADVVSLLNCRILETIAGGLVGYKGGVLRACQRDWLDDPFEVVLTLTNLSGVAYSIAFTGPTAMSHEMILHRDHLAFAVPVCGPVPTGHFPPDVLVLPINPAPGDLVWSSLGQTALATGAFPIALEPREIWRDHADFEYRFSYFNGSRAKVCLSPSNMGPPPSKFYSIDGGATDNEPFESARRFLSGSEGSNPREGHLANRAVILIDPFSGSRSGPPQKSNELTAVAMQAISALKNQCRFKPVDIALAYRDDVYSRFLIAPTRVLQPASGGPPEKVVGNCALCSGALGGFMGFFYPDYRQHDFMLGRANCQAFLRDWFVLPDNNPLFNSWPGAMKVSGKYASGQPQRPKHLQIIPILDPALQSPAPWPRVTTRGFGDFSRPVMKRLNRLYPALRRQLTGQSWWGKIIAQAYLAPAYWLWARPKFKAAAKEGFDNAIKQINAWK